MIVVDTNVIASLWVPSNNEDLAYQVLEKDDEWVAPLLWRSEFRNVLTQYLRNHIIDFATIILIMGEAEQLMEIHEYTVNSIQVLKYVSASTCSSYDCEFISLAAELHTNLISFDKKLISSFPKLVLHPLNFIQ